MNKTKIAWTDYTSNPIRAVSKIDGKRGWWCSHVSAGCEHCYSEVLNKRWGNRVAYRAQDADKVEPYLEVGELDSWRKIPPGSKVFLCDMTDLFHERVSFRVVDRIFNDMWNCPQLTFQILTKRPQRMREYLIHARWLLANQVLPNVWLGVSCEDQRTADERIPQLLMTPAAVRFVSAEPLLGPINFGLLGTCPKDWGLGFTLVANHLDWIIVGGESGPHYRRMELDWARSIKDQCKEAGVRLFFKQQSGPRPGMNPMLDGVEYRKYPSLKEAS